MKLSIKSIKVVLIIIAIITCCYSYGEEVDNIEYHKKWFSFTLIDDSGSKVRLGTKELKDKNISFVIDLQRNKYYTTAIICKKDFSDHHVDKHNQGIPVQVRIDEGFTHKTTAVIYDDDDYYRLVIDMYDDFITDSQNGNYLRIKVGNHDDSVIVKFSLQGFSGSYNRSLLLLKSIKSLPIDSKYFI